MLSKDLSTLRIIIITSLDGILRSRPSHSFVDVALALNLIEAKSIPLIFCSSKTRAEVERYRKQLKITDPFIVEDGGAIFIKKGYFKFHFNYDKSIDDYHVIELGPPCSTIRIILSEVEAETKLPIKGYGDMSVDEVASITGLDYSLAALEKKREYQETLVTNYKDQEVSQIKQSLTRHYLTFNYSGQFFNVMGQTDKGKAASMLINLYRQELGDIWTVGIGNSKNDLSMLSAVDLPVLLQKPDGTWEDISIPNLQKVDGMGPIYWNRFIFELLS